ncbi:MAG TPA: NHL domain-containing thioredoxin family protein [Micromonosporaceae bacterium]|nr:NHL domain-containing thioredoxin family protein [Micromonosporaceae bacterium]
MPTEPRVRAPELRGRAWLNTGDRTLTLADLRGRFVLLDFWTFCCINCLHVIDELRPLEERHRDHLVVIGVHSPKFEHEKDPAAVAAAVERYGVHHPVLDDPTMRMWQEYTAKAWPTLCLIDPEGYVVATMAGEGHVDGLTRLLDELIEVHRTKGTLAPAGPFQPTAAEAGTDRAATPLRFPGKALVLPAGTLLVADSANHRLVEVAADGHTPVRSIGDGTRGRVDGRPNRARFAEPGGLCLLPRHVAEIAGYDVVVADTVNHLLRGVRLDTGDVTTVAGSGRPWRGGVDFAPHDSLVVDLSSPWDVAWFDERVIVAMAGSHQLWWFDPVKRTAGSYAGTDVEALRDGALEQAWMAQPSGLSASPDGTRLWVVDSESSALRWVGGGELHTAVGQGLFDFGHVDGPASAALLQHPLGVLALPDGTVLVADTYNSAVRRFDPRTATVSTVATGLAEPSDLVRTADGVVLVIESAAHRLTPLALDAEAAATGERHRTERPPSVLAPGEVVLEVIFEPGPGSRFDESFGPATRLEVSASPPGLLLAGAGTTTDLHRRLVLSDAVPTGVLQVSAQAATCDAAAAHPACHLTRQDWGVPVRVAADGAGQLALVLRGVDAAT